MGVIGPNHVQETMPNTSRQASRYNEPEKHKIPRPNAQAARLSHLEVYQCPSIPTISIANP